MWKSISLQRKMVWCKRQKINMTTPCLSNWDGLFRGTGRRCAWISVLLSTKAILGPLVVSTFHCENLHSVLMCVVTLTCEWKQICLHESSFFSTNQTTKKCLTESRLPTVLNLITTHRRHPHPHPANPYLPLMTSPAGQGALTFHSQSLL